MKRQEKINEKMENFRRTVKCYGGTKLTIQDGKMHYLKLETHQVGLMASWTQQKKGPINVKKNRNDLN